MKLFTIGTPFVFAALLLTSTTLAMADGQRARIESGKPTALECDSLVKPLGDDTKTPLLSWKLQDGRIGAKQTAYRILVASTPDRLKGDQADVWDSGRVEADRTVDVAYGGPQLSPEKRYYWRVQAWDMHGKAYPASDASWWETGLLDQSNWTAKWIGYEDAEQASLRAAHAQWVTNPSVSGVEEKGPTRHDFRLRFDVPSGVKRAVLYVTGEDTVTSWISGAQVLKPETQPAWGRTPWKTYTRVAVTKELHSGDNLLAIEVTRFSGGNQGLTPMSAALYIEMADGSSKLIKTGDGEWKTQFNASGNWYTANYDDTHWGRAIPYAPEKDAFGGQDKLGDPLPTAAVAALRHSFRVSKQIASARLYATALGAYKFSLNGKPVGDQVLAPGWTDYRQRVTYQDYDVTALLQKGENAIGAYLAPGWYSTPLEWIGQGNNYGDTQNALKAQLRVAYTDGTADWIATDQSWKADSSPILSAEIYNGETYDARRHQQGWDTSSFSDAKWHSVSLIEPHEPEILWQSFQPIHGTQVLQPKSVTIPRPGIYIYDFGQDFAGVPRIHVQGKAGTNVQLRFGELLNPDGTLYVENLRNAKATDHFILAGTGVEEYQPTFTFHGFRYMEITGLPEAPSLSSVQAVSLNTDAPLTAEMKTGNAIVNQLWSNILWGQRSNFLSVPTDCPQRDERLGWTADAQVFWRTATFNMDLTAFSRKYADDLRGTQTGTAMYGIYAPGSAKQNPGFGPGWSDAGVIVPWTSWIQNGDQEIIQQNWDAMSKYVAAILAANPDYVWKNEGGIAFGDWLAPEGPTSQALVATAYWAYDVSLMQQMAHAVGRTEDEQRYAELFEKIKAAFMQAYVHPDGFVGAVMKPNEGMSDVATKPHTGPVETQTGYVLALHMRLLPDNLRASAATRLVNLIEANGWKLGTGFLGTPYLMEELSDTGHADVAYRLLLNTQYPSWGYMVDHGATTMWERWNGDKMIADPGMNSFNHYAYGAVGEWLYRYAAGIDATAADAGLHTIMLHPNFDARLGKMDFSYESRYGTVHSQWTVRDGSATWNVTIPPNTSARLSLSDAEAEQYAIDGNPLSKSPLVKTSTNGHGENIYELAAGTYNFTVKLRNP
ncbi:MAG: family 78 glycoside hydrolase catalytic domain [Edaphobacter sp.]|uniref:family 78 glycoside hydrolase catalytic domain n=1 Tax=Edaphobacter sp. TaxID=1934404 RepID=UPI0029815A5F|nr:family 78 glycoside hydrolase catalytic domain [Edaphobacter sp.]MDW5267448.1 family 78 glycoside hydrolase catalytic domain [Edaphobacter sp.]